jgi:type I restriction enzyme S subunit
MTNRKGRASKLRGSNILACAKGGTAGIRANLEEIGYGGECWATKRFDQCAELIRDTVNPSDMRGVPYIGLEHIAEGQLELAGHGSTEQVTSIKSRFRKGDILFGKLRPYFRKVVIAPFDGVCSTDIWVVRARQGIDLRYLFYWMASPEFIEESTRASEGTRMPRAQWEFLGRIEKPVPPLKEQQAIACILGALDDKIELNRRMNRTLEEMARAIFKSWFVDFDPVRAKATVRRAHPGWTNEQVSRSACPNLKPEIAALFPDSFEDSELGQIPKGWKVQSVGDIVTLSRDALVPGDYPDEVFDHYSIPAYDTGQNPAQESGSAIKSQKFIVTNDCILVSKLNPKTPRVWIPEVDESRRRIASTEFLVCRLHASSGLGRAYFYCLACDSAFSEHLTSRASGTSNSHQRVRPQDVLSFKITLPSDELARAFNDKVGSMTDRFILLKNESRTLAALRDTLLPKLISGELRVKDAERIARRCV